MSQATVTKKKSLWAKISESKYFVYLLISPLVLILIAYVLYPMYKTFTQSLFDQEGALSLGIYLKFFTTGANLESLYNSVIISVLLFITFAIICLTMTFLLKRYYLQGRSILYV